MIVAEVHVAGREGSEKLEERTPWLIAALRKCCHESPSVIDGIETARVGARVQARSRIVRILNLVDLIRDWIRRDGRFGFDVSHVGHARDVACTDAVTGESDDTAHHRLESFLGDEQRGELVQRRAERGIVS